MKKSNYFVVLVMTTTLLFTSCSKEDNSGILENENAETATLSFGVVLNDLMDNKGPLKQEMPLMPECSDEAPASVEVVLSLNGNYVVGDPNSPVSIPVNSTPYDYDNDGEDEYFTDESSDLELAPGDYVLEYFQVLDAQDNVIWTAPIDTGSGDDFSGLVNNALPMDISLDAGVKKYVPVEVLCFDDRVVNEYGYLFFDIEGSEAIEFCLFGNVCDENGRHYPASFRFDVWTYSGDPANPQGTPLFDENNPYVNTTGVNDDGDDYADPLCLFLPDTDGEDIYYGELYLIENGTSTVIRSGEFSDADVRELFDGEENVDYYHFREGDCNMDDSPALFEDSGNGGEQPGECDPNDPNADCDNDGVINANDECPSTPHGVDVNEVGCDDVTYPGGDIVVFNDMNMFDQTAMEDPDNVLLVQNLINFSTMGPRNNGDLVWLDRGREAPCNDINGNGECSDTGWSTMRSTIENEGFTVIDKYSTSGSITEIPGNVKIVFLVLPTVPYTVEEVNTLKAFAAEGGRIVFIGEHQWFYPHTSLQNQFLQNMGAVLYNTGGSVDCDYTTIPSSSNREHPIMEGIDELTIACASIIELGPNDLALFYDDSNTQVLAGVARIDTTPINQLKAADYQKSSGSFEEVRNVNSSTGF